MSRMRWAESIPIAVAMFWAFAPVLRAEPVMHFVASTEKVVSLEDLRRTCPESEVEVEDPYHRRRIRYFAMPLRCVLDVGFTGDGGAESLRHKSLLLRALDGYTRPVTGADLLGPGPALAYGEVALMDGPNATPRFSPIDRRKIDPAPFYLIWSGADRNDPHTHPWPYQLSRIEVASFSDAFPATVPSGLAAEHRAWSGYATFQRACAACHSINRQGGKVGPDLNVPKSIVEYRPIDQIKSYIRNPQATRYTSMPAHPEITDSELDALIEYFEAMRDRKHDPRAGEDS